MRVPMCSLALAAVVAITAAATTHAARAADGSADDGLCTASQQAEIATALDKHSGVLHTCEVDTGYMLYPFTAYPTSDQQPHVCNGRSCPTVISSLASEKLPDCNVEIDGTVMTIPAFLGSICDIRTDPPSPTPTPTPTPRPSSDEPGNPPSDPSTSPSPGGPSDGDDEDGSPSPGDDGSRADNSKDAAANDTSSSQVDEGGSDGPTGKPLLPSGSDEDEDPAVDPEVTPDSARRNQAAVGVAAALASAIASTFM